MATAPSVDEILGENDLYEVVGALLDAKNRAYYLGMALKLPTVELDGIRDTNQDPQGILTAIIKYYLTKFPNPTKKAIVDALRSSVVNLPRIADKVETTKLSNTTQAAMDDAEHSTPPPQGPIQPPQNVDEGGATEFEEHVRNEERLKKFVISQENSSMTPTEIRAQIIKFEDRFNQLKWATRDSLKVPVVKVVDALADLPADDIPEHKHFLDSTLHSLYDAQDQIKLFADLTKHMNYLSFGLIDYLVGKFNLGIKDDMQEYKEDLKQFREKVPLQSFCKTQTKRWMKPSKDFVEMVAEFKWPKNITLEVVEQFRKEYAFHYKLRDCAMMVAQIQPGSFIVTWYIPKSIAEKLKNQIPQEILQKYSATKLEIDGCFIFGVPVSEPCKKPDEEGADSFNELIVMVTRRLSAIDIDRLSFIFSVPHHHRSSALNLLQYLQDHRIISRTNIKPLIAALTDIGRDDLASELKIFPDLGKMGKELILTLSFSLTMAEVATMSYISDIPHQYSKSALDAFIYLEKLEVFSFSNMEPLLQLMSDIHRFDLAMLIKEFIEKNAVKETVQRRTASLPVQLSQRNYTPLVSKDLSKNDASKIRYIHQVPAEYSKSTSDTLNYLGATGTLSESDPKPLIGLLKEIGRYDLAEKVSSVADEATAEESHLVDPVFSSESKSAVPEMSSAGDDHTLQPDISSDVAETQVSDQKPRGTAMETGSALQSENSEADTSDQKRERRGSFWRALTLQQKSHSTSNSPSHFKWKVLREELVTPVWKHQEVSCITQLKKIEINLNRGRNNPKLTFQLFPYGLNSDKGEGVTMAIRNMVPIKCPPLPLAAEINLDLVVSDGLGQLRKEMTIAESLNLTSIFVYSVLTHDALKMSRSKHFILEVDIKYKNLFELL